MIQMKTTRKELILQGNCPECFGHIDKFYKEDEDSIKIQIQCLSCNLQDSIRINKEANPMRQIPIKPGTAEADAFDWALDAMLDHFLLEGLGAAGTYSWSEQGATLAGEEAVEDLTFRLEEQLPMMVEEERSLEPEETKRTASAARRVMAKVRKAFET